ncbi:SseB family protein [Micromonospora sp. HM5-17]|uniref:SseB family protein n=1 Tax=Micromonospora sp. HM5-17 TaxID=2487710 RepID=UPI000F4A21CE|nr:SseB family protein [Micromonospora sp. HM5-17]ROT34367.1 hypothetical protein EF879_03445 [Micromonospora sp. HM5-17]
MTEWEPATETEAAMRDALRAGDQELYFRILSRADLLLPVSAEALAGRAPMGWGTWTTGGRTHVLAFTSATALQACLAESAGSSRRTAYPELAAGWPNPEWWLAVNPGLPIEGYLPAWFVSQLGRGDVRLPGRTRARLEQVERVTRARATATVPRRVPSGGVNPAVPTSGPGLPFHSPPSSPPPSSPPTPSPSAPPTGTPPTGTPATSRPAASWFPPVDQPSTADRSRVGDSGTATVGGHGGWGSSQDSEPTVGWMTPRRRPPAPMNGTPAAPGTEASAAPSSVLPPPPSWTEPSAAPGPDARSSPSAAPGQAESSAPVSGAPRSEVSLFEPASRRSVHADAEPATASPSEVDAQTTVAWSAPGSEQATVAWTVAPSASSSAATAEVAGPSGETAEAGGPSGEAGSPGPYGGPATSTAHPAPADSAPAEPAPGHGGRGMDASSTPTSRTTAESRQRPVDFVPATDVERSLLEAAESGSTDSFLSTLLLAQVLLPVAPGSAAGSRPGDDGFEWRTELLDGDRYVVVFTSPERLADHLPTSVETVEVKFVQLIRRWPDDAWSFAVNPGTPVGAKLPGSEIVALANWAAEVGLGDDPEGTEPAPAAPTEEEAPRSTYAPPREEPGRPTMMQKTVAPSQVSYYLERGYDRVSGFVHRASEVAHLRTPAKLYAALGLNYPNSPFSRDADEVYVLRWPAYRPSLYRIPYGGQNEAAMRAMEGWVIERPPFRGNGFAPGESSDVVAEFKVDSIRLPHGAQLWRIGADGSERLVATLDCDVPVWRRVEED